METIISHIPQDEAKKTAAEMQEFLENFGTGRAPLVKTRLIGITKSELFALARGASLILGQPREGMEPITAGQELLCIVGYIPGEAPRMDTPRVRVVVTAGPFEAQPLAMLPTEIAALTGHPVRPSQALADIDLTMFLQAICSEIKTFEPATSKLLIPIHKVD